MCQPVTLLCLPFAGGGAAGYFRWARRMAPAVRVVPVEIPGRDRLLREPVPATVEAWLDGIDQACAEHLTGRFAIYGHSLGALIAALWTLRWQAQGRPLPECLFLGARGAPVASKATDALSTLDDDALLRALDARFGGTSASDLADAEMRALLLPTLRGDLRLVEAITPAQFHEPIRVPVHLIAGRDDPATSAASLEAWRPFIDSDITLHRVPGGHFFHFGAGEAETLALITQTLATRST